MSKIRRERNKYHAAAPSKKVLLRQSQFNPLFPSDEKQEANTITPETIVDTIPSRGLFDGIKILPDALFGQKLPDFDARSVISNKSEAKLSKKDKRKQRHEAFLKKIEASKVTKRKKMKKQNKPNAMCSLNLLVDALPTHGELLKLQKKKETTVKKFKSVRKASVRQKEMLEDAKLFQRILKDPAFKADPHGAIAEHLRNTIPAQSMDTTQ